MDKLERLYALHGLFDGRRRPTALAEVVERLECSPATAKRAIRELRTLLGAPLIYDPALGGYRYSPGDGEPRFELPGLWFRAEEIAALVTLREVLARLEPGLLNEALSPLARRLEEILARRSLGLTEAARRVRVLSQHAWGCTSSSSAAPLKHGQRPAAWAHCGTSALLGARPHWSASRSGGVPLVHRRRPAGAAVRSRQGGAPVVLGSAAGRGPRGPAVGR